MYTDKLLGINIAYLYVVIKLSFFYSKLFDLIIFEIEILILQVLIILDSIFWDPPSEREKEQVILAKISWKS